MNGRGGRTRMGIQDPRAGDAQSVDLLGSQLSRRRLVRLLAAAAVAAGVTSILAACGGGDSTDSNGGDSGSGSGGTSTTPSGTADSGSGGSSGEPKQGGRLIIGRSGDSDSLDPQHTIASISWQVFQHIYDPLIGRNLDLEYEGVQAERWEVSADDKER